MKYLIFKNAIFLVACLGIASNVPAHDEINQTLGADPTATDYKLIQCQDDSERLEFELNAGAPSTAPTVSAQIQVPDQGIATNVTDPANGDVGSSRTAAVRGGATEYYVTVGKSGAGKASYSFVYHCLSRSGEHTGTDLSNLQVQ